MANKLTKLVKGMTAVVLSAVLAVGCATTGGNSTQQQVTAIQVLAATGTEADLISRPQDRPYFVVADSVLKSAQGTPISYAQLQQELGTINVNGQQAQLVALGINDALLLIQSYNSSTNGVVNSVYISALEVGISTGLNATGPTNVGHLRAVQMLKLRK